MTGDQCQFGALTRKRTSLGGMLEGLADFGLARCKHVWHPTFLGKNPHDGTFHTQSLAEYPLASTMFWLAELLLLGRPSVQASDL